MKVLLINNFHYRKGGSESVYFNLADLLREHGHEVIFFSQQDDQNLPCAQSEYFVRNNKAVSRIQGVINYFYNKEAKYKLEKLIFDEKPDIAHVHLFWGGLSPSIFKILQNHRIPLVHTVHDYRMVCPAYTFKLSNGDICEQCKGRHFYKCIQHRCSKGNFMQSLIMTLEMYIRNKFFNPIKNIDGFVFVSEFSRKKHQQYIQGITDINSIVLYNVASSINLQGANCLSDSYFLFFGRLSYEKGIVTLIKAFCKMPHLKLFIVGVGSEEKELKDLVIDSKANNIEFLGYKSGDELLSIVSNALFVIVPSEWYENNPMTIIESYACGVPVIGSKIGGIPEIIEDGKTGFLFEPKDITSLCALVLNAQSISPKKRQEMGNKAIHFAQTHFNKEMYYEKLIEFYKHIIDVSSERGL